jgi:O-antigen ligase
LTAFFAFNSGGFYPGPTAYVAAVLCVVLILRITLAGNPLAGAGRPMLVGTAALGLYALLTLLSQLWSHAPGEALIEFDRALVCLLVFVLSGSLAHTEQRLAWMLKGLAVAIVAICACSLLTRVLPHLWPTAPDVANQRLSFPLTYWNALGLFGAFGLVLCLHFSSDLRESAVTRIASVAALPVLAVTIYFTFSRGGIAAAVIGIGVYVVVGRPRAVISGVLAAAPAAVAVVFAYHANLLATPTPTVPPAVVQGRHVAIAVLACAAAAALVRALLTISLDRWLLRRRLLARFWAVPPRARWTALTVVVVGAAVALNGPISHEFKRFVRPEPPGNSADLRARLTDPGNNGRIDMWRVAWRRFEAAPVLGHGAGTFEDTWARYRPNQQFVRDAHSLYLETLDELGVVGFLLLVGPILVILVGAMWRARDPVRSLYAAASAVLLMWALHAGIDWDWEMPVLSLPFFALGGFVLSREAPEVLAEVPAAQPGPGLRPYARTVLGIGCVLLAVAPAYVWLSQRKLDQATAAFARGDCRSATAAATSSISILGNRPEPYEILGYCDIRRGMPDLAMAAIQKAITLDPGNWNYRYDLAVVRASAGLSPVQAIRQAVVLDPREPLVEQAAHDFTPAERSRWQSSGWDIADSFTSL